ncbi:MAG: RDD family protein [Synergistaceae bacterium]|jgi:uncharacterized RDD family membrane protein YckC|nr:RDD family protein [Synergistaceae bacterium]
MINPSDRIETLIEGTKHRQTFIVTPEGVPLGVRRANHGERFTAFAIDMTFMLAAIIAVYMLIIPLFFSGVSIRVGMTVILFLAFVVRNMYFLHFELAWRGRTPGKRICGLLVINRFGGALTPSAIFARNLTREVEIFLPLSLLLSVQYGRNIWSGLALLGWALTITSLPFFNRGHLRAGDIIGGTQVIFMPRHTLTRDLSIDIRGAAGTKYIFTQDNLSVYGAFELQVLEELLRRPPSNDSNQTLEVICGKICRKIGWDGEIPREDANIFLREFYAAQRAELEHKQLFGHYRADKTGASSRPDWPGV